MNSKTLKLVTLGYLFDTQNRVLLMLRNKSPNKGLWSPPGGKIELGESPFESVQRELVEETGLTPDPASGRLVGLVSESDYEAAGANYLIFLYGFTAWTGTLLANHAEGALAWHPLANVLTLPIPETDRQLFWPRIAKREPFSLRITGHGPDLVWREEPL